jgi:hypothetical protein
MKQHLPNFFIIGAPKCGTTALSEYLRLHPNVFFCNPKEPEFFADDFNSRVISHRNDYVRLFQAADPSRHIAVGEGSVLYIFSKVAVLNILKFRPDAKIIVMLRNPVELVVSLHAQLLIQGEETIPTFLDAWYLEPERKRGNGIPRGCRDPQWLYYSEWGKLGTQLQRVMQVVPKEQLKVILYDDFARDTRRIYRETLEFLNLPDDGRDDFPKVNERRMTKNLRLQNTIAVLMRWWLPWRTYLTGGRGLGVGKIIHHFTTLPSEKKQIPNDVRGLLLDFYRGEIGLLEKLLERDLSTWMEKTP